MLLRGPYEGKNINRNFIYKTNNTGCVVLMHQGAMDRALGISSSEFYLQLIL